ncbi:MAG: hypothetical protein ABL955_09890 [Elusimicrobiota bacterium]
MNNWVLLVLLAALPARAGLGLEGAFAELSKSAAGAAQKAKKRKIFPFLPVPALEADASLPVVLDAPLPELRDAAMSAVTVYTAGREWTVGATTDEEYDDFHLVLTSGARRLLAPLAPLRRFLSDEGVVVSGEDGPVLRLNARISLLHPINGTSVVAVDAAGGQKTGGSFEVGELIDALKSKGRAFSAGDLELHLFVQSEAAADGKDLSGERSIFLARFAGMKSRGWAIRESALAPGKPVRGQAFGRILVLLKTEGGRLIVRDAGPAGRP